MESLYLCFSFLVLLVIYALSQSFLLRSRGLPPSPFPRIPLIGHLYWLIKPPFHRSLSEVAKRYGPVLYLRFGSRPVVLISSSSAAQECFTKNDVVLANRPPLLVSKHLGQNYMVWTSYGDRWRTLRRIATVELLSSHRIQMLSAVRVDEVRALIGRLFDASAGNSESSEAKVDIKSALFELAFNVMTRMITGKKYYGENVENFDEAKMFQEIAEEITQTAKPANLLDFMPFMRWFGYGNVEKKLVELNRKRDKLMQNAMDECRRMDTKHQGREKNLIQVLLTLQETDPQGYSDEIIKGLLAVLYQASTETTASTMEWAFSLLLSHPEVMEKAQAEIDTVVGNNHILQESDVGQLSYLRCIIKETLRVHPPAPLLLPHYSSEDCTVQGFRIPRRTMLLVNAWAIQNDPEIWIDHDKFKPERFEDIKDGHHGLTTFMPFGLGRRGCPGETLAMRSIGLALGSLLQCFHWERITEELDMGEGSGFFGLSPKSQPLMVKCSPRPHMLSLFVTDLKR